MKCYSPEPQSKYAFVLGDYTYQPVEPERPAAWNLVWLSLPKVDDMLKVPRNTSKFFAEIDSPAIGMLSALTHLSEDGVTVQALMGPSPTAFVQSFSDTFDLPSMKVWTHLGGQAWLDCMTERAYQSEGLAHVYETAAQSANVILGNFTKRRVT